MRCNWFDIAHPSTCSDTVLHQACFRNRTPILFSLDKISLPIRSCIRTKTVVLLLSSRKCVGLTSSQNPKALLYKATYPVTPVGAVLLLFTSKPC